MPKRRPHALLAALTAAVLALAACTDPQTSTIPPQYDVLEAAQEVPLVATQGLTLMNRVDDGLTLATAASARLDMITLEAVDFDGYPFVNLTFTAPGPIHDVWQYATTLTPDVWAGADENDSPYGTVITGATTARTPVSLISNDLSVLLDLTTTLEALGGEDHLDAIVAATPTTLLMRDATGAYWDTSTAELADPDELQAAITQYADMREGNNTPELLDELEDHWAQLLTPQRDGEISAATGVTMTALTAEDGSLDLTAALATLELQQPLAADRVDSRTPVCSYFLWIRICHTVEIGSIAAAHQGHDNSGAYQTPASFGRTGTFNIPICVTGGTKQNAPAGCGPTAFASLLWRDWAKGEPYLGLRYNGESRTARRSDGLLAALTKPNSRGVPLISAYMGACYLISGSMVTPAGFVDGANAFLKDQGKQAANRGAGQRIRLTGNTSYLLGNPLTAGAKATMLRTQLGQRNNPMVALYWPKGVLSTAGAHYSLIEQYRITSGGTHLVPDVAIMAVDTPRINGGRRIWHSLTDVWLPATGVYYLDRY